MVPLAGIGVMALALHNQPVIAHYAGWPVFAILLIVASGSAAAGAWDATASPGPAAPLWHFFGSAAYLGVMAYYSAALLAAAAAMPDLLGLVYSAIIFVAAPAAMLGAPIWRWAWNRL